MTAEGEGLGMTHTCHSEARSDEESPQTQGGPSLRSGRQAGLDRAEPVQRPEYDPGQSMAAPPTRVLMIGVDAGDVDFIEAAGEALPNLRRVLATGRRFDLESTADVLTGSVWPTFYTGTLPGEHGVYHPIQWDPRAMRARRVSEDWLYCEPFWH